MDDREYLDQIAHMHEWVDVAHEAFRAGEFPGYGAQRDAYCAAQHAG